MPEATVDIEQPRGEIEQLRAENAELRRRMTEVDAAIETLRAEAIVRRAAVRELAESLPTAMSRRALLIQMGHDVRHHPDKAGVVRRGIAKLGRAPAKLARIVRDRYRSIRTG
jgi:chromosome segregation ATPase